MMKNKLVLFGAGALALLLLPLFAQYFGNGWVRILDSALLYMMLALGLNIVVGYAGLLDLGYIAFYAVGAYMFALLASPHLTDTFDWFKNTFQHGLHAPIWVVIPLGALVAGTFGVLLGAPTLRLRGDYLAIVTLGFGEIIRVFLNNLDATGEHHQRPEGHRHDRLDQVLRPSTWARTTRCLAIEFHSVTTLLTTCSWCWSD
jgi:branched-chain amino acid transport system permease protein